MTDQRKPSKMARVKIYQGSWTGDDRLQPEDEFDARVGVNSDESIFGLVDDWHLPYDLPDDVIKLSHMSYRLDEWFAPVRVIARLRDPKINFGQFLFNAGGMGYKALWVEVDDMEKAFQDLGLL